MEENKVVKLDLDYVASDWRRYVLRHELRTILISAAFIFISFFVLYVIGSRYLTETISQSLRFVLLGFLFGVPLVSLLINLINVERLARARARRNSVEFIADETGVSYSEDHRWAKLEWPAYRRGIEHNNCFVFFSSNGGLLIPKRCFTSAEQLADFRQLAKQGLNSKFWSP